MNFKSPPYQREASGESNDNILYWAELISEDIIITWRNLIPRIAEVAKTLENTVDPLNRTTIEADTTIKSEEI